MNIQKSCFEYFSKISWDLNTGAKIPFLVFEAGTRYYLHKKNKVVPGNKYGFYLINFFLHLKDARLK